MLSLVGTQSPMQLTTRSKKKRKKKRKKKKKKKKKKALPSAAMCKRLCIQIYDMSSIQSTFTALKYQGHRDRNLKDIKQRSRGRVKQNMPSVEGQGQSLAFRPTTLLCQHGARRPLMRRIEGSACHLLIPELCFQESPSLQIERHLTSSQCDLAHDSAPNSDISSELLRVP